MKLLLILPAYNEEGNILKTVNSITAFRASKGVAGVEVDYLVINDGSTDGTEAICRKNGLNCLSLVQNLGIGGAVQTGYLYAYKNNYDIAVQFDGDGQHDIESLPDLLAPILEGTADFSVGSRFLEKSDTFQSTFMRRMGIKWLSFVIRLVSGLKLRDVTSGYRAANKDAIAFLAKNYPMDYPEPESSVALKKNGFRIQEVQVNMFERSSGASSISFGKSIYYMIKVSLAIICAGMQRKEEAPRVTSSSH